MIGSIRRTWEGTSRMTVIVWDKTAAKEILAYLWTPEQSDLATVCANAELLWNGHSRPEFAIMVEPKSHYGYHITAMERIHDQKAASA